MATNTVELASTDRVDSLSSRAVAGIIVISAFLVAITAVAYFDPGPGITGHLLRQLSMGGENSVGAWWSGAILFLGAVYCLDGAASITESARSRRGWVALALIMLALSFDEVSSLHEFIARDSLIDLAPIGVCGMLFFFLTIHQLLSGGTNKKTVVLILIAFSLFGTVPIQEYVQHAVEWDNQIVYGIRAAIEEGTEISAAIILLIAITKNSRGGLLEPVSRDIILNADFRRVTLMISILAVPLAVAASFVLPHPGGPADWLAAAIFLLCAITTCRTDSSGNQRIGGQAIWLPIVFVCASAMSCAIKLRYQLELPTVEFSARAAFFSLMLLTSIPLLQRAGRNPPAVFLGIFAGLLFLEGMRPEAQIVWRTVPAVVAVVYFWIESRALETANRPVS